MGYSLFTGGVIDDVTDERWIIFSRALPPSGKSAVPLDFLENRSPGIWLLSGSENEKDPGYILGLFNWNCADSTEISLDFTKLGLDSDKQYIAFSFWDQRLIPGFHNGMNINLSTSGCMILNIREKTVNPGCTWV